MGLDLAISVLTNCIGSAEARYLLQPTRVVAQLSSDTKLHPVFFDPEVRSCMRKVQA